MFVVRTPPKSTISAVGPTRRGRLIVPFPHMLPRVSEEANGERAPRRRTASTRPASSAGSRRTPARSSCRSTFDRISGGRSNLTYSVADAGGRRWALRRPPLGKRLASAHDMGREHRVVSALGPTPVPVPPVVGLCEDDAVNGAPFYVMDWVEGPILRSKADGDVFPGEDERRAIGERVVDTLVAIHAVDPDEAGLGELAKKEDYVARQLHRWQGSGRSSTPASCRWSTRSTTGSSTRIPEQGPATIVHGDYRLDNMILAASGEVAAVVDWELCTLGDPLADVGLLLVYWGEEGDDLIPLFEPATMPPGFLSRDEVRARYAERSGRDLCARSTSTSRSATGSWRSSSRACSPATRPASTATRTRARGVREDRRAARRGCGRRREPAQRLMFSQPRTRSFFARRSP